MKPPICDGTGKRAVIEDITLPWDDPTTVGVGICGCCYQRIVLVDGGGTAVARSHRRRTVAA